MIKIVKAGFEELKAAVSLLKQSQLFHLDIDGDYYNSNVDLDAVVISALNSDDSKIYLAAMESENKEITYCGLIYIYKDNSNEYDYAHSDYLIVKDLIVDKHHNGLGIGRELINRAAEYALSIGCSKIKLSTHYDNVESHKFYNKIGFDLKELILTLEVKE